MSDLGSTAAALLVLSFAVAAGLLLGRVQVHGVRLGITGVLFSSLAFAQAGFTFPQEALPVVRDLALVLFIYTIGLQVGPSFFTSFRAEGLRLNLLSGAVLLLGVALVVGVAHAIPSTRDAIVGVYSGSFTSTPALAGGQVVIRQVLAGQPGRENHALMTSGMAYAITYPLATIAPVILIPLLRRLFGVRMQQELTAHEHERRHETVMIDFEIVDGTYAGRTLHQLPRSLTMGVVLSRIYHGGVVSVPRSSTPLQEGDVLRAVGTTADVHRLIDALGRPTKVDLSSVPAELRRADLLVTRTAVLRRSLRDLHVRTRMGVTVLQLNRAGVEIMPHGDLTLKFGDRLTVLGPQKGIELAAAEVGNEAKALNYTYLLPVFVGLTLGVLVGAIPFHIPGMPISLRIGLAGGPFLAAIALSQLGNLGSIIWYMPAGTNQAVRDLGLCVFLACVGFQCGGGLIERAAHAGIGLIIAGAATTFVPLTLVACFARLFLKMNFITLTGWLAGTMTSAPALAYAIDESRSDAPTLAYATVTPLCEIFPILCAEVLALLLK